jgi:hypothetical protein
MSSWETIACGIAASPAVLLNVRPVKVIRSHPVMSKQ